MPLNKKHYLPNKKDRECEGHYHPLYKMATPNKREFQRIEDLLDEITVDVVNGKGKSEILLRCRNGTYENMPKGVSLSTAEDYYKAVMSRLQLDEIEKDNARSVFYSMYLNMYEEAMSIGNHLVAKGILDSMVKLMGLDKPQQTNIQINNADEGLTINFNLPNKDESDV